MSTYTKQMQSIVTQYRLAGQPWPAQSKAMFVLRIHSKLAQQAEVRTSPRPRSQPGEKCGLKADVDSYNDLSSYAESLQIVFDFTMDLAEIEAAA